MVLTTQEAKKILRKQVHQIRKLKNNLGGNYIWWGGLKLFRKEYCLVMIYEYAS